MYPFFKKAIPVVAAGTFVHAVVEQYKKEAIKEAHPRAQVSHTLIGGSRPFFARSITLLEADEPEKPRNSGTWHPVTK
ncbi:hypothetical protein Lgee_1167 [Legionella geestiana]|uniref:Uncharacterized protein n=1 Tax=Legionella geestiana TaxID=45065 RepID=A0A0W0TWA2_9GAMM|nr:hypothetical protein [Legionella geestiana]KTC99675.1 hypothetical protein Lgee_1167 [Legionella geestiana]QBS13202.1 hypothetical protein E4T54_10865 [Legionella geestiana]QDQ39116.1 hypothetical protein E3226_001195 [Legionella geestiana]STX54276.1 Uncharacterised protein [Legionella geestiana]